ncbi:E3 ubiquitin ligase TRAF3IP2 [Antennarius striatus]|uniref:E3 ubiquitin ligase TRAF3IP2 n=1 Tax=Antennarius striatus TaxID=241820 RepID=UPI0035B258BA
MMMPSSVFSASAPNSHATQLSRCNMPEEDDETMSTAEQEASTVPTSNPHLSDTGALPECPAPPVDSLFSGQRLDGQQERKDTLTHPFLSYVSYLPPRSLPVGYGQPTPFPSRADSSWLHRSLTSSWFGNPSSLPSSLSHKDYWSSPEDGCMLRHKPPSSSGRHSSGASSLEQPLSLCSNPPSANLYHHSLPPYTCSPQGAACCAQCPAEAFIRQPVAHTPVWPLYHQAHGPYEPGDCRRHGSGYTHIGPKALAKENSPPYSTQLSLEQRRVFVTYEADNDKHVNEIINFVALLRHNGFDTHIDIFEQQFRSISKIDFMERYLSEKDYLIIIIISPKYYQTVTAPPVGLENDERTFNTVYIHKQLQNEFIHNGSKNFRFIPIVFPGARKCHVPNWLQNTHVYAWPRDRDDILRRLMRVEKYNPPPIGSLPTIVSIPI